MVLASRSPHRLELLRGAGYVVEAVPADIDEPDPSEFGDLDVGLIHVAILKAFAVYRSGAHGLIFAADTVGVAGGAVLGKPADRADALRMLPRYLGHGASSPYRLVPVADIRPVAGLRRRADDNHDARLDRR